MEGNYLGLNAAGTATIGNGWEGIDIYGQSNTVGGTTATARNVISGNGHAGIWTWAGADYSIIEGNYIGTDPTGTLHLGNGWTGVTIFGSNLLIGGTGSGEGNLIAYNGTHGIEISMGGSGNQVLGNSIYGNNALAIDMDNNGVTPNDLNDTDGGSNNQQNFPVLDNTATITGTQLYISGSLNSVTNTDYRIEFYANTAPDSTGYGQGQRYLGYTTVHIPDGSNNVAFAVTLDASVTDGEYISATATNLTTHDTSEFCQDVVAHTPGIVVTPTSGLITTEYGTALNSQ